MTTTEHPQPSGRKLLTIAIPTYNRARFLERLLRSIQPQLEEFQSLVEVLIVDNASGDDTNKVVRPFLDTGLPFRYIGNQSNIGMDANIRKCFIEATTEYVWIFGDDDVLTPNAVSRSLSFLKESEYALVHVGGYSFSGEYKLRESKFFMNLGPTRVTDAGDILYTVASMLTFISRNIINKRLAVQQSPNSSFDQYMGSIINQLSFVFAALKSGSRCLIISEPIVAAQLENSGGYSPSQVFGNNLLEIVGTEFPNHPRVRDHFANHILENHFPHQLYKVRNTDRFYKDDLVNQMKLAFANNYRFWIYCYPIATLPLKLASAWSLGTRAFLKSGRMLRDCWWHVTLPRSGRGPSHFTTFFFGQNP